MKGNFIGFFVAFLLVRLVTAADVQGLYEAEVPVFGQTKTMRDEAIRNAMLDVLVKVSGVGSVLPIASISAVLAKSSQYVQQYRYRDWPADRPMPPTKKVPKQVLWARFDKQAIDNVLQNAGLPIWGRSRPTTLVWVVVEDRGERYMLGTRNNTLLVRLLQQMAQRRGVPLLLPLMDLEDQISLRISDIWGDFQEEILRASARYQTEGVLVGRVYQDAGDYWQARWTLYENDQRIQWYSQGATPHHIFEDGIGQAADTLAKRYSQIVDRSEQITFSISVMGINATKDYAHVNRYLKSLASVLRAYPVRIEGQNVNFQLEIRGSRQGVIQAIDLGNILVAVPRNESLSNRQSIEIDRIYRFVP